GRKASVRPIEVAGSPLSSRWTPTSTAANPNPNARNPLPARSSARSIDGAGARRSLRAMSECLHREGGNDAEQQDDHNACDSPLAHEIDHRRRDGGLFDDRQARRWARWRRIDREREMSFAMGFGRRADDRDDAAARPTANGDKACSALCRQLLDCLL